MVTFPQAEITETYVKKIMNYCKSCNHKWNIKKYDEDGNTPCISCSSENTLQTIIETMEKFTVCGKCRFLWQPTGRKNTITCRKCQFKMTFNGKGKTTE